MAYCHDCSGCQQYLNNIYNTISNIMCIYVCVVYTDASLRPGDYVPEAGPGLAPPHSRCSG